MFKKLDIYIIKKYLTTFLFVVLIFLLVAAIIDFSEKVEKFVESGITRKEIFIDYYPSFMFFIAGLLWPLLNLIAVIFFTSRMASNSEIISIFNAGVSFRRLMVPYLFTTALIAGFHYVGNHYFIPDGNKTMMHIIHTYIDQNLDKGKTRDVHMFVNPDTKIYVNYFRKRDSTARKFRLERFSEGELVYLLKANTAEWLGPPGKWRLRSYEIRTFNGAKEELVIGKGKEIDTTLNLRPEDFVDYKEQQNMMNTPELKAYIANQKRRGVGNTKKYEIELYRRSAESVTIFILTIIGMSIAGRKVRGGLGIHLILGISICGIFIFLSRFAIVFATGQAIPALLGIWLPNIVFAALAVYLIVKAQK